jgi:hypothetical protein
MKTLLAEHVLFKLFHTKRFKNTLAYPTGHSQIHWLCENLGLTPATPHRKHGADGRKKEILGFGWQQLIY